MGLGAEEEHPPKSQHTLDSEKNDEMDDKAKEATRILVSVSNHRHKE